MNAFTKSEALALSLPERAAVALGTAEHEIKLRELVLESVAIVTVTNKAGREECHSAYMKLKNTRVNIGHKVNEVTEDAKLFTKAVKTEAERLVAIMMAEEDRLQALRDTWDEAEQARKDALIAAERERVDAIRADMQAIRDTPVGLAGANSAAIRAAIDLTQAIEASDERFAEYAAAAGKVLVETVDRLVAMLDAATAAEDAAAAAEAARIAEAERMAAERAELARLRAEADERDRLAKIEAARVAAEQAATAKRLADAEAELQKQRDIAAAAAQAEADKVAAANAAAAKVIADAAADLAAKQAAFKREQDEAKAAAVRAEQERIAAIALAEKIADAHDEAMTMNTQVDTDREAERVRLQELADQQMVDARDRAADEHAAGLPAGALGVEAIVDALPDELYPEDSEIVDAIRVMFMAEFGIDADETDARMQRFDYAGALAAMAA